MTRRHQARYDQMADGGIGIEEALRAPETCHPFLPLCIAVTSTLVRTVNAYCNKRVHKLASRSMEDRAQHDVVGEGSPSR